MARTAAADDGSQARACARAVRRCLAAVLLVTLATVSTGWAQAPVKGEAPTIDLVVGYHKANTSPVLKLFLSRIDELTTGVSSKADRMSGAGPAHGPR